MRIERLGLVRFGVFTDYELDWAAPGLHLVVGRNAAGKSTIRVAVAELLYGIHHRSSYATQHDLPKLALEATIRGSDGSQLEIVRHKRNKDPLTTGDGAVLAESDFLARHLGGIGREEFAKTFAIDHDELKHGSAKLLESGGDLALALFDSRSGAHLTDAFTRLDERADELYKKGGTKPRLNSRIAAYLEAKKELKDAVHRPAEWRRLTEIAEEAATRLAQLESELSGTRRELERLTRLRDAIPALHLRTRLYAERAALAAQGPVVLDETADTLQAIVKRLDAARDTRAHAQIRLRGRTKDLDGVDVDETLLSHAHSVQTLLAQAHAAEQAEKQAVAAARRAAELTGQAERALARAKPGANPHEAAAYAVPAGLPERVDKLRTAKVQVDTALRDARQQLRKREVALASAKAKVKEALPDESADALKAAAKAVPPALDDRIAETRAAMSKRQKELSRLQTKHALPTDIDTLAALRVPTEDAVAEYRQSLAGLEAEAARLRKEVSKARTHLAVLERDHELVLASDPPPTEDQLHQARKDRERVFNPLRDRILDPAAPLENPPTAIAIYESAVVSADDMADHIRTQADRAAERLQAQRTIEQQHGELRGLTAESDAAQARRDELKASWPFMWLPSALPAPDPANAPVLIRAVQKAADLISDQDRDRAVLDGDLSASAALRERLTRVLTESGAPTADAESSLAELVACAEEQRERLSKSARERARSEQAVANATAELTSARDAVAEYQAELDRWDTQWRDVCDRYALSGDPAEVNDVLATMQEVSRLMADVATARVDAQNSQRDVDSFIAVLTSVARELGRAEPETPRDCFALAATLDEQLRDQQQNDTRRKELREQIARLTADIDEADAARQAASGELDILLSQFGVADMASLTDAVQRTRLINKLSSQIDAAEISLAGSRTPLDVLEEEANRLDPDALPGQLLAEADRIEQLQQKYNAMRDEAARAARDLELLDGSATGADASDRAASMLAEIVDDAEEYLRVHLARQLLSQCIEQYRAANQNPILARAQQHFSALTDGAYTRVIADTDPNGKLLLAAEPRSADRHVRIEHMSEGTLDQLYLALRLAGLDRYLQADRGMPLLLDDLFITFDDVRTTAGLRMLDQLADRVQVIIFTHHTHVADLATKALPADRIHVHPLPASSA